MVGGALETPTASKTSCDSLDAIANFEENTQVRIHDQNPSYFPMEILAG